MNADIVIVVIGAVVALTWPWWARAIYRACRRHRRRSRRPEVITDWCEKCNKPLRDGEVWEIRSDAVDDAKISDLPLMGGGTYMSATYCEEHAPPDAKHVP